MTIFGVDVSAYQGQIDFAVLKTKAQFMYMRGAWAKNEDYYFQRNATEATGHGIPWGVYFVPTPGGAAKSWQIQADYHASLYQTFPGLLPPAIDLEQDGGMDKNDLGNWLEKYYAEFMMKSGAPEAMIYTRAG